MIENIFTRMGDGSGIYMSREEIQHDLQEGTRDAADRGNISELSKEELDYLFEIIASPVNVTSVIRGKEVVTSSDSGAFKITYQANIAMDRATAIQVHEKVLSADSLDLGNIDYSYKAVKSILHDEAKVMENVQLNTTIPILYGAMPNLGLYTKPDGPVENWSELLPLGKIAEARAAQEEAVEHAVKDMVYIAEGMYEAGADGMNFDTCGASGDADVLAALKAIEIIKQKYPDLGIEMGMAGEFILGMHGQLEYDGTRLAGLYPHKQVEIAEKAGVNIFGPVVNTNSNRSFPWNIARAVTFIKACSEISNIPVHANVGMGVGGTPMSPVPPADAVSRAVKAIVEIGKADGL
ncbi:MAG: dimethylamine methyltransferase [Desulfitibacter sp. BRH_c19]|nr:MAG: dimethylamine methyltransferase [Desulfitibacter sp. BRH_c19]